MKKVIFIFSSVIILSLLLAGCSLGGQVDTVATAVAGTLQVEHFEQTAEAGTIIVTLPVSTPVPVNTVPPVQGTGVSCSRVSFTLDPNIAAGITCETITEASGSDLPYFGINPEYTHITLTGYMLPNTFHKPQIFVYPVERYLQLIPDVIPDRVAALQNLISGGSPVNGLPFLPMFNAAQEFHAKYRQLSFTNGSGIRFITQYSQAAMPINNHELFYTFQGLTSDNAYWVSVILPVSNPILPADDIPPNGVDPNTWMNQFEAYIADLTTKLDAQPDNTYAPTLALFDALVQSIVVQP